MQHTLQIQIEENARLRAQLTAVSTELTAKNQQIDNLINLLSRNNHVPVGDGGGHGGGGALADGGNQVNIANGGIQDEDDGGGAGGVLAGGGGGGGGGVLGGIAEGEHDEFLQDDVAADEAQQSNGEVEEDEDSGSDDGNTVLADVGQRQQQQLPQQQQRNIQEQQQQPIQQQQQPIQQQQQPIQQQQYQQQRRVVLATGIRGVQGHLPRLAVVRHGLPANAVPEPAQILRNIRADQAPTLNATGATQTDMLPGTVLDLVLCWRRKDLGQFARPGSSKRTDDGWTPAKRVMYSKWLFLFLAVEKRVHSGGWIENGRRYFNDAERMRDAAIEFDLEKGDMSMSKFLEHLKSNSPSTKKRRRRNNTDI